MFNPQFPLLFSRGGNPNGNLVDGVAPGKTAGVRASQAPPDLAFDTSTQGLWVCTTTGTTATVWEPVSQRGGYAFDVATPPSAPITLLPGDRLRVTFEAVPRVSLHVACVPGVYRAVLAITATNTTNSDLIWEPNDAVFSSGFSSWIIENSDGSASGPIYVDAAPIFGGVFGTSNCFYFDQFGGPSGYDPINDIGPSLSEYLISTVTAAKMIKYSSGITGGPASGYCKWSDTVTPWTSLGTIADSSATSISGYVVVERLA